MNKMIRTIWLEFASAFPVEASKIAYFKTKKKLLNLKAPKLFDEKLEYLKLYQYADDPLVIRCADKYAVREYVERRGCGESLNDLYGVWDKVQDIPFDGLKEQFVLKCTHGCHMNIICSDKKKFDSYKAKQVLEGWMKERQWREQQELHYRQIKPRIICEKYLQPNGGGQLPIDYKIYCFNGEPKLVLVITDREHEMELTFRDLDWNLLEIGNRRFNATIECPGSFEEMIEYSRKLSAGVPFVRVDFFDYNNRAIFGEMTFTPAGCNADYYTEQGQSMLGDMLEV